MPKRDLSPASRERNQRPLQQQKSVSDIIGPMVDQCHLDLAQDQSLASLASQNALESRVGSTGSSRQNSNEGAESYEDTIQGSQNFPEATDQELAEEGYTDADGVVGDAFKAVGKAGKKVAKSTAEDIENVVQGTLDVIVGAARHVADDIEDTVDSGLDLVGKGLNVTVGIGACVFQHQFSLEEKESNNVYISHPTKGAEQMVPMGMHIEPCKFKNGSGQMVLMVAPGELAEQAFLKESDVIIAIGDNDVTETTLDETLHIFGTISSTFSMTVVRRMVPEDGTDIPNLVKKTITVEVQMNDNVVAIKVLDVKCSQLMYTGNQSRVLIQHKPDITTTRYIKVKADDDGTHTLEMSDNVTSACHFHFNVYSRATGNDDCGGTPCSVHNVDSDKALDIQTHDNNAHRVILGTGDGLTNNNVINVDHGGHRDFRFFHMHHLRNSSHEVAFESSQSSLQGYFLAVEDDELHLTQHNDDLGSIPAEFRFTIAEV